MSSFVSLFIFYFVSIHCQIKHVKTDCSIYTNDVDVINENPFYVRLSLNESFTSVNYAYYYDNKIRYFYIFNDFNPNTNIYCLTNLENIKLINTNLWILPDIKKFQKLSSLTIQTDNGAITQHLPPEFGQLLSLRTLELSDITNLEDLPNEIGFLKDINSLTLRKMPNFNNIPDKSIGELINLQILILVDLPKLSYIPSTMNNFKQLHELEISGTNIADLKLKNLTSLGTLRVARNSILKTVEITSLRYLYSLNIQNNSELLALQLQDLSLSNSFIISSNKKLLYLNAERLTGISRISITDSEQLKAITLKTVNGLNSFILDSLRSLESVSFDNVPYLSTVSITSSPLLKSLSFNATLSINSLDLSGCQLTTFPESILTLKSLETLVMTSNQFSTVPMTISMDLPNLKVLNLANNRLHENVFQLPLINIRQLNLTYNLLSSIDGIGAYKSLEQANLDYNQISLIPAEIMKLSSILYALSINYNRLNSIPYSMANMRQLRILSATNNNITDNERFYLSKLFKQTPIKATFESNQSDKKE